MHRVPARQVALIKPKILVCLGRIPAGYILGREIRISSDRGIWHESKGFFIMSTYHPAALPKRTAEEGIVRRPSKN